MHAKFTTQTSTQGWPVLVQTFSKSKQNGLRWAFTSWCLGRSSRIFNARRFQFGKASRKECMVQQKPETLMLLTNKNWEAVRCLSEIEKNPICSRVISVHSIIHSRIYPTSILNQYKICYWFRQLSCSQMLNTRACVPEYVILACIGAVHIQPNWARRTYVFRTPHPKVVRLNFDTCKISIFSVILKIAILLIGFRKNLHFCYWNIFRASFFGDPWHEWAAGVELVKPGNP